MYQVQMQYIPNYSKIWVAKLNEDDPLYEYETEAEAIIKKDELQTNDTSGRLYRIFQTD